MDLIEAADETITTEIVNEIEKKIKTRANSRDGEMKIGLMVPIFKK